MVVPYDGNTCPVCGSERIAGEAIEPEGADLAFRSISCEECNSHWVERFVLSGVCEDSIMVRSEGAWAVGDVFWRAAGELQGIEHDIGATDCRKQAAALREATNWLAGLSDRERLAAAAWLRQWRVTAVENDQIDAAETTSMPAVEVI